MRSLRWVGFVFSLLIVGVLGGLMAPLPSEAIEPATLTLYVDSSSYSIPIFLNPQLKNSAGTITGCTQAEWNLGYRRCYTIPTSLTTQYSGTGPAGVSRGFTIQNYDATATPPKLARLYVGDGTGQDLIRLSNVEFVPYPRNDHVTPPILSDWGSAAANGPPCLITTPPTPCANPGEKHTLKMVMKNKYDLNPNGAGTYIFAMKTSGLFGGGPLADAPQTNTSPGGPYTPYGNYVQFEGMGTFNPFRTYYGGTNGTTPLTPPTALCILGNNNAVPSIPPAARTRAFIVGSDTTTCPYDSNFTVDTTNLFPLRFQANNPIDRNASFGGTTLRLEQIDPSYPDFSCRNKPAGDSSATCTPDITVTMTVVMFGPDIVRFSDPPNAIGVGPCKLTPADGVDEVTGNPLPCHSSGQKKSSADLIKKSFTDDDLNFEVDAGTNYPPAKQCLEGDNCPCFENCTGTIIITMEESPPRANVGPFPFFAASNGPEIPPSFTTGLTNSDGVASTTPRFSNIDIGNGPWSFKADLPNFPPLEGYLGDWKIDTLDCKSLLNTPAITNPDGSITPAVNVSEWDTETGSGKDEFKVSKLGKGDIVTCNCHGHKNSSNAPPK